MVNTIEWTDAGVVMIDQTKLPAEETYVTCGTYDEVADAIRTMVIRGAPAIGVAAAMGIALGMKQSTAEDVTAAVAEFQKISKRIAATRPTAVNLFWAVDRMTRLFDRLIADGVDLNSVRERLVDEAIAVKEEDIEYILQRHEEEFRRSFLRNKIEIDNTELTPEQALAEFVEAIQVHLTEADRARILTRNLPA